MKKWICIAALSVMVQGCSTLAMNFPPFTFGRADGEYQALAYQKEEPTVNIYSRDWRLEDRVRGNEIFDRNWKLEFRIKDNAIYNRGWSLNFRTKR
jgi:hypothetical protein